MEGLAKLARRSDGATAIEFALVAPILFLFLFGIIELSLFMFASSVVEGATSNAARLSKTGAERSTADSPAERAQMDIARLKELVLDRGAGVLKADNLTITTSPQGGSNSGTMGASGEIVIYNIAYEWDITTPFMGEFLGEDGVVTIVASTAVVNEPFDDDPDPSAF